MSSNISSSDCGEPEGGGGSTVDNRRSRRKSSNKLDSGLGSSKDTSSVSSSSSVLKLSRNAVQIEALLKRINDENMKTKQVLENIQKTTSSSSSSAEASPKDDKV